MSEQRRSQRANKGQHSKRSFDEVYDEPGKPDHKIAKIETDEDYKSKADQENISDENLEEDESMVRCTPCGLTNANYDEATDTGGTMLQCDNCNSWQHAKCMGFKSDKAIPDHFECNVCNPAEFEVRTGIVKKTQKKPSEKSGFSSLKESHRISTAKAFANFFETSFPEDYKFPENFDKESLSKKWALEIENIIHDEFPKANYNSESRRILFLLKKRFMGDLIEGNLTFHELVNKTPEEINQTIKQVKQKLKQNIKNIVLVQADERQIIRRTHKGEEIRDNYNEQPEGIDESITTKSVDHRRFSEQEETVPQVKIITKSPNISQQRTYFHSDDEDEQEYGEESNEIALHQEETGGESTSEFSEVDHLTEPTNDELLLKLTGEPKNKFTVGANVWEGKITFPDYATFNATGRFYSSTATMNEGSSVDISTSISKEILSKNAYEVEGRLDRDKADKYLNIIISSRDLYLIQIIGEDDQYQKLYDYLLIKNKVGVLSGKPYFVKDAYLIPIDFRDEKLPSYLVKHKKGLQIGLFALFVVKKDYEPKSPDPFESIDEPSSALSAIMSQLGGN